MKLILIITLVAASITCIAQHSPSSIEEGMGVRSKIFTEEDLIAVVKKYHPVAKQAAIDVKIADAEVKASRGAFDPVLNTGNAQKEFDGLTYYNQTQAEIKIPAWYGIDLYAGKENINGSRINPEETKGSLNYIGISVPLIQNFIIDKRRAAINQAKLYRSLSEVQRKIIVNDLLFEALKSYWEWWEAKYVYELMRSALNNAEKRLTMVRTTYQLGDRAAIDTLEAFTQLQSFSIMQSEAYTALFKAQLQLSVFLWKENNEQYDLPFEITPQQWSTTGLFTVDELIDKAALHPEVAQYGVKLNALQIDRRLKLQSLLPQINLKYNRVGYDLSNTLKGAWFQNDYRFGISLSMPLRLSQGRGEYLQAKLKIDQARIEQAGKQAVIYTKVKQYFVEWQQTNVQLTIQQSAVNNYSALQRAEETKFSIGESSLFLINTRELKTIDEQRKLITLKAKNQKAAVGVRWAAASLVQ